TLPELAVVLVIVSLLVGGLLIPLSTQIEAAGVKDTRRALAEIREALLGFVVVNGRLPCPALATTARDTVGAGVEGQRTPAGCNNPAGVLPWATLGLAETDPWGRRYTYRLTPEFGGDVGGTKGCGDAVQAAFLLCTAGDIDVYASAGGVWIAQKVPAVIVSHGKNGNGAFTSQGSQLPLGADADELVNQLIPAGTSTANPVFVSRLATTTFDDDVTWLPPGVLFSRMISAGKLP
ncbi:MAG: prepilin-type cleavage/methylation domain-containing protein, partial [Candidatus Accumulibacter sp.]|nr:prepilin-type cleavage/methylation domain-containing protein [Accumulibacter sp.]